MNDDPIKDTPPPFAPPVSSFMGPVAEMIAQGMLAPPSRPGLLATLDQYEILRLIGGGGMGVVLLARDSTTGREMAVKLVKAELVMNQTMVYRFLKEAGHLKRLRHPNVVAVETISDRSEGPYFVMPYFAKGSLANRIKYGQPLAEEATMDIASQVAEGLSFAHRNGIIHRDLKPANILLAADGHACLADFGLARTLFNDTITEVGNRNLEGTAPYMSPAVAAGDAEDTRCDIYSFGALLYEMLTGQPPYQGRSTKEILDQIIAGPPKPVLSLIPQAERGLVAVAEGCMARELRDRYADMKDVLADLQRIREDQTPKGRGSKTSQNGTLLPVQQRALIALGTLLLLASVVGVGWLLSRPPAPKVVPPVVKIVVPPPVIPPPVVTNPVVPKPVPAPPAPLWNTAVFAGQPGVSGFAEGAGTLASFTSPNSVAADPVGNVYVADTGNDTIRKITPDGVVTTLAGMSGSAGSRDATGLNAKFFAPFGLAVDAAGTVYVADTLNNTIRKISPAGEVSTLAGLPGHAGYADGLGDNARFRNPWGIAVDQAGNVYVADRSNNTIRKITHAGLVSTLAGRAGWVGYTNGIAGKARFNAPSGVATDRAGNVYVADSANDCIRKITPGGVVTCVAGLPGYSGNDDGSGDEALFANPQAMVVDDQQNIYVADTGNDTIRKINPAGEVTTLAGMSEIKGAMEGAGVLAQFDNPDGITLDRAGNIFVADTGNNTIRKIVFGPPKHP